MEEQQIPQPQSPVTPTPSKKFPWKKLTLILVAFIIVFGGIGSVLAWKTTYLDNFLPASVKEFFGRGEEREELTVVTFSQQLRLISIGDCLVPEDKQEDPIPVQYMGNDHRPQFKGTFKPSAEVCIRIELYSGEPSGEPPARWMPEECGTVDKNGDWSWTPSYDIPDGIHWLVICGKDEGETVDSISGGFWVNSEFPKPYAGTQLRLVSVGDLSIPEGQQEDPVPLQYTGKNYRPQLKGTFEPGKKVCVSIWINDTSIMPDECVTADDNSNWSWTPSYDIPDGAHWLVIKAFDNDEVVDSISGGFWVNKEFPKPYEGSQLRVISIGVISIPEDKQEDPTLMTFKLGEDRRPQFKGTFKLGGEVCIRIELYAGEPSGNPPSHLMPEECVTVDNDSNWSWIPSYDIPDGIHWLTINAKDEGKVVDSISGGFWVNREP